MTDWPNGARGAVAFTFDFDAEEVRIADDPENANRPGLLSQGTNRLESEGEWGVFHRGPKRSGRVIV